MPDDRNVPVGGAGQTHSARVKFASDTVREKVGDLLAEAGGTLAAVNEDERRRVATRLRKAKAAAPLNLLPLLTLLLAACGKAAPDIAGQRPDAENGAEEDRSKEDGERAGPPGEGLSAEISSGEGSAGDDPSADDVSGGWRFIKASTRAGKPPLSPEAEANMVRLCLQEITDNSLQASAIHEICSLIDLDAVDRSHDVIWRWNAPPRTEGYSTNKVCYLVNAQDLLFWMFMESPAAATGYTGRVRPKSEPEIPGAEDGITDASLLTVVAAVPEAAAAAGGGFGGGLAALPLLALGGGGGGGGGGGASGAAAALAAPPVIPAASEQVPEQDGQVAAPPEQVPVEEPAQDRPDPQPDAPPLPQQPLFRAPPPPPPPPREEAPPEPVVPPEQPAPVAPPPDPFAPGSAPAGGQPISFFVTDDPVENARITYSQLTTIIILTAVMGAFNIWG